MVASGAGSTGTMVAGGGHAGHAGHAAHGPGDAGPLAVWPTLAHWQLMVVAMMFPLILQSVRTTAFRSFAARLHRAIGLFLLGHLLPWTLLGAVVAVVIPSRPTPLGVATAFAVAAVWQLTPTKRRALVACHRSQALAPRGWSADRDCALFGARIGTSCVMSCWALMLACTVAGHVLPVLLACGLLGAAERFSWRPRTRWLSGATAALGVVFAVGWPG
ncbi:MAG: hypothetical protein DWQ30_15990 [Acidobacteria bacterium]|nr:MAG: hypothetical protein DWQ30_15990 [Acidobacteriota bacterium]